MKTEIAKHLRAANMEIPFVTTDLELDGARKVMGDQKSSKSQAKSSKSHAKSSKNEEKSEGKNSKDEAKGVKVEKSSAVSACIAAGDVEGVVAAMKEDASLKDKRAGLDYLVKEGYLDQAAHTLNTIQYNPNEHR